MTTTTALSTKLALDAIAYERAPRANGFVNYRVVCADGFKVSVQASSSHYANDSQPGEDNAPYWRRREDEPIYPFVTFELGAIDDEPEALAEWESGGVWAWVPRKAVKALLESHGGAVAWDLPA